jgi:hypothetical protein
MHGTFKLANMKNWQIFKTCSKWKRHGILLIFPHQCFGGLPWHPLTFEQPLSWLLTGGGFTHLLLCDGPHGGAAPFRMAPLLMIHFAFVSSTKSPKRMIMRRQTIIPFVESKSD